MLRLTCCFNETIQISFHIIKKYAWTPRVHPSIGKFDVWLNRKKGNKSCVKDFAKSVTTGTKQNRCVSRTDTFSKPVNMQLKSNKWTGHDYKWPWDNVTDLSRLWPRPHLTTAGIGSSSPATLSAGLAVIEDGWMIADVKLCLSDSVQWLWKVDLQWAPSRESLRKVPGILFCTTGSITLALIIPKSHTMAECVTIFIMA